MRQRLAILAAAVPALLLSAKLFHVLFEPLAGGNRVWVVDAVLLMLMEFIMVHAGFMSIAAIAGGRKHALFIRCTLGFFYMLFVLAFALGFGQPWAAVAAGVLLAGRIWGSSARGPAELGERILVSVLSVVIYMVVVIGTTVVEPFPAFGFTPEVLEMLRPAFGKSKGVWVDEPHRAVAAGAVYFLLNGLFELARLTRVKRQ